MKCTSTNRLIQVDDGRPATREGVGSKRIHIPLSSQIHYNVLTVPIELLQVLLGNIRPTLSSRCICHPVTASQLLRRSYRLLHQNERSRLFSPHNLSTGECPYWFVPEVLYMDKKLNWKVFITVTTMVTWSPVKKVEYVERSMTARYKALRLCRQQGVKDGIAVFSVTTRCEGPSGGSVC